MNITRVVITYLQQCNLIIAHDIKLMLSCEGTVLKSACNNIQFDSISVNALYHQKSFAISIANFCMLIAI